MENQLNRGLQIRADFMMLLVVAIWGSSYLFMKMGLESISEFNLVGLRFGFAFLLAGLFFYKRMMKVNKTTLKYGFILGTIVFLAISCVTIGLKYTTVSNAGFSFGLAVIFVPILLTIIYRKKPEMKIIVATLFSITGIGLMTLNEQLSINLGDFLCIIGALLYALFIITIDKLTKNVDSIALGILQLGFTGAWGIVFSFIFETPHLPNTSEGWIAILALSILCSAIGFIGQTVAQKYTTPTHTSLIFSLEPVFAALFAFMFMNEVLQFRGYIGAFLILLGVLTAEVDLKKLLKRKAEDTLVGQTAGYTPEHK
ncbi:DMT family transporter [Chungangia koreensis]|uniref:DMT family transporter n=1 Tax=Chungangia koreensis TaxID=752657 RepID=A0ABV8X1B6_9LACT